MFQCCHSGQALIIRVDIYCGYDEMIYVIDDNRLNVLDQAEICMTSFIFRVPRM